MCQRFELTGAKNLELMIVKSVLYIYCDLRKDCGASSSGKTILISSSRGNKALGKSGAFLGLNIFTKSLDKRSLSSEAIAALCTEAFTDVGDGCQWRIEKDNATLCIRIDFDAVKERPGSSGKSKLLATTGGNKPIASTGLSCGMNCFYPVSSTFSAALLTEGFSTHDSLQEGQTLALGEGFSILYHSANDMHVTYTYVVEDMLNGETATLPSCPVGDLTVNLLISAPKPARARTERRPQGREDEKAESVSAAVAIGSGKSTSASLESSQGVLWIENGQGEKVRNVEVVCVPVGGQSGTTTAHSPSQPEMYTVDVRFDPTQSHGRSSSGKSLMVASTGGFQRVVDGDGRVVCRLSLNAYRPAPPITEEEVAAAVQGALSKTPKESWPALSFKSVLSEVSEMLGLTEAMKESMRPKIKDAIVTALTNAAAA